MNQVKAKTSIEEPVETSSENSAHTLEKRRFMIDMKVISPVFRKCVMADVHLGQPDDEYGIEDIR